MAQGNVNEEILDQQITDVCEKLHGLQKRERDINENAPSEIDLVEKDVLL